MIPWVSFTSIIPSTGGPGDLLAGEYFLDVGGMILRVTDKDEVRERHFDGVSITGTSVLTQKYYDAFSETEVDYKPATGKGILCFLNMKMSSGGLNTVTFKVWANTTLDSKSGARDVFGSSFSTPSTSITTVQVPPFILKAGEYLNVERVSGSGSNGVIITEIVGVERDAT